MLIAERIRFVKSYLQAMLEASGKVKKPGSTQKTRRVPRIAATLGNSDPPQPVPAPAGDGDTADIVQPVVNGDTQPPVSGGDMEDAAQPVASSGVRESQSKNSKSPPPALLEEFFQV